MMRIELEEQAWRQVLACLAKNPWEVANPLIMAIGEQMQRQTAAAQAGTSGLQRGNSGGLGELHPAEDVRQ